MLINDKCFLCGGKKLIKRMGSVRDDPELEVFECSSCGLVFLSSFEHVKNGFYESSKMHGKEIMDIQAWLKETDIDDQRRFQYLKSILSNCKLLDFGVGLEDFF